MSRKSTSGSSGAAVARRQPLLATALPSSTSSVSKGSRRGSRIGETTGECAAVCCCCPCTMMNLILAVYRFPKGIWRRRRKKMLLRKKEKLLSLEEKGNQKRRTDLVGFHGVDWTTEVWVEEDPAERKDAVDWDNQMWDRFDGAGFWRSGSPRKNDEWFVCD